MIPGGFASLSANEFVSQTFGLTMCNSGSIFNTRDSLSFDWRSQVLVFVSHFSNEMGYYNVVTGGMPVVVRLFLACKLSFCVTGENFSHFWYTLCLSPQFTKQFEYIPIFFALVSLLMSKSSRKPQKSSAVRHTVVHFIRSWCAEVQYVGLGGYPFVFWKTSVFN